jgi:hypothetical protein
VRLEADLKVVHEADPKAVHEVDLKVVHEVDPAVAHEAPLAGGGQQGRDVVVAALVRQCNTQRERPTRRIIYMVGLSSHTLFSSQATS